MAEALRGGRPGQYGLFTPAPLFTYELQMPELKESGAAEERKSRQSLGEGSQAARGRRKREGRIHRERESERAREEVAGKK